MGVSFYNFKDLHNDEFRSQIKERISKIIDTGAFVEGEWNTAFEQEFAKMQGAKHCLLLANGTDALEIALEVHNVGHGDKVGVPGITFYATSEAVLNRQAIPVWIDIDPKTGLMCPDSLERVLSKHKLKAIMPVHIYGLPADMTRINEIAKKHQCAVIEDAAQAQGAFLPEGPIGCSNNMVTFSFYPTKNLSALGDAGAILTNNDAYATAVKKIRNHGRDPQNPGMGRNSRCDHIHAAALHLKLEKIEMYNKMRKEVARKYHEALRDLSVDLLPSRYIETSSWHLYPIRLESAEQRQKLQAHLATKEIGCTPFYEYAQCDLPVLKNYNEGETKEAKAFAGRIICLPIHPFISDSDIATVTKAISEITG